MLSKVSGDAAVSATADAPSTPPPSSLEVPGQQASTNIDDQKSVISKPASTLAPTFASTVIPAKLESGETMLKLGEEADDDAQSQTSYATSMADDDSENLLSVMRLEEVAQPGQPFECPYCWTIQKFSRHHTWR